MKKDLLRLAVRFHGHLGPFLILGVRMGLLAKKTLRPLGLHEMRAVVWSSSRPPQSCVVDGIQISSGCTLGKGNIRMKRASSLRAKFFAGNRSLIIRPTRSTIATLSGITRYTTETELRRISLKLNSMQDKELLVVERKKDRKS